ncbi:MAG: amino acid ABC transporter ATP-binding protein [Oscillospiraceae bacterium]|nr:amino acid ABC transporter ATP-binding protein [Oscillospiraceae bacterium]MBQ4544245.1 amino acid ABC transporter ATP-binding protein [Oscillospiraceae bacterium]MBQ6902433.1 amino acid ABC transporter ATP-binding protein [Oscillospiraceae bacterium]
MAILEVNNLYKSFGKTEVLRGIDFSMEKGEVLSVIGSSGSGKTTLLRCINALEVPTKGKIVIDGDTVYDSVSNFGKSKEEQRKWQLACGLVFQSYNLFPQYSALENVMLAPKLLAKERDDWKRNKKQITEEIREHALSLLDRVGLSDKVGNYPCELSGGQQQRVAIARALALSPKVLFFDEPTSALDPQLTLEVLRVIRELADMDMTMVIVTHEMKFARDVSDRIIFMADGLIEADGTPDEVFDGTNEKLRAFLGNIEA